MVSSTSTIAASCDDTDTFVASVVISNLLKQAPINCSPGIERCQVKRSMAAVCCIFTASITDSAEQLSTSEDILYTLKNCPQTIRSLSLSLLFIKRAYRKNDKWSGDSKYFPKNNFIY